MGLAGAAPGICRGIEQDAPGCCSMRIDQCAICGGTQLQCLEHRAMNLWAEFGCFVAVQLYKVEASLLNDLVDEVRIFVDEDTNKIGKVGQTLLVFERSGIACLR